jgi:AcrR family transcriptional regulator
MARPTNADAAATRKRLLDASTLHFTKSGKDGASLRVIAKSAGVSLATINHYFGNKHGLYTACRQQLFSNLQVDVVPIAAKLDELARRAVEVPADQVLEELVREGFRFGRAQRPALRLLMRTLLEDGELDSSWRDDFLIPFMRRTAATLSAPLGRPAAELIPFLQAVVALGMRFALSSDAELALLTGAKDGVAAMEDQLVLVANRLLLDSTHV